MRTRLIRMDWNEKRIGLSLRGIPQPEPGERTAPPEQEAHMLERAHARLQGLLALVGDLLTEAGVPNAVIDLDWLRRSWPSPAGDRFNVAMALRNLRSVARNYRDAGAVRIVLGGVIETKVERDRHQDTLGVPSRCAGYAWTCRW